MLIHISCTIYNLQRGTSPNRLQRTSIIRCNTGNAGVRTRTNHLLHESIEAVALRALHTKKVPVPHVTLGSTVVAHNIHHPHQIGWHGLFGDISRTRFPRGCHALLGHDCLFADGTSIIKASQLAKAMSMDCMTARKILGRLPGREHAREGMCYVLVQL